MTMVSEYIKFLFLLGFCWMSKVGVTLGQSRNCTVIKQNPFHPGGWGYFDRKKVPGWRCNNGECVDGAAACIKHKRISLYSYGNTARCSDGSDESIDTCCASTCPSDPDICIQEGQEILPGQDCRDCTRTFWEEPDSYGTLSASSEPGWRCNSGHCVQKWGVCNGHPECPDGSDESPAMCCASTCPSDLDICIPAGQKIEPDQNCRDCTDRFGDPGWRCNSGQCVRKKDVCNGYSSCLYGSPDCSPDCDCSQDCSDGSDESPAACCPSTTCPSDPDICIPAGIVPGEDCRNCTVMTHDFWYDGTNSMDPGWRCNSGECLGKSLVCDGSPDCRDGSDESPATCCPSTCPSDPDICIRAEGLSGEDCRNCTDYDGLPGWRCNSGQCVRKLGACDGGRPDCLVCDGSPDCSDGSDESPATCCASTCPSDPDICIQAGQEIKSGEDCRDCTQSDGSPGWRCNSGQCLLKFQVCDGSPHCSDGEDESPATCCASTCPSDPDICIPSGNKILPEEDCRNCTGEWGIPQGWRCNMGQCLHKKHVCDGSPDCPDRSDESPAACCSSTCPSDPDICIPAGQEILSGEDCRDCTRDNYWNSGWRCNSGECLFKSQVCDGVPQCQDGSDESTFFNLFCRFG